MRALRLVWPLLAWSAGACQKSEPARTPPTSGSSDAPGDAAPAVALAVRDASIDAVVDAAVDAAPPPELKLVIPGPDDFGCLGWSPRLGVAACVVGQRGFGMTVMVELVFVAASADVAAPPPITLVEVGENAGRGPDTLPPEVHKRVVRALEGFVPWDRKAAEVASFAESHTRMSGKPVGGMAIKLEVHASQPTGFAPAHRAVLSVRAPDGTRHEVSEMVGPIGGLEVRAFPLRDRAGQSAVLVEEVHGVGDEGLIGTVAAVWRCTAAGCAAP